MKLSRIPLPNFKELIRPAAIDEIIANPDSVSFVMNINFDRIGAIQTRNGITAIGNAVASSTPILGLHNYINNAGTTYRLLAKAGTAVYDYDGVSWSSRRTGLTSASKARFTSLVDYTFMVNGHENQSCATYNGSNFGTTNVASLPAGDFIENYRSRVWILDSSTDKLYYSNVVTTSNTITGGGSYIQISPQDGDVSTGLKRSPRALLVFKKNHIYRVTSINSVDPDPYINVGTYSNESIVECKDGIAFHSPKAFYLLKSESTPVDISKKIIDVVKAIPRTSWENVCGWEDGDNVYWSIGDITLDGISLTNVVCRYTLSTQLWTLYSYPIEIRSAGKYDDGTNFYNVIGGDTGYVYKFDTGNDDAGTPIFYNVETQFYYISNVKSDKKKISEIVALFENAQGSEISYKIDNDSSNTWKPIKQLNNDLYQKLPLNAEFTRIKFKLSGNIIGSPMIFRGFELLTSEAIDV